MKKEETTPSITWAILFTAMEIWAMRLALMYTSLDWGRNGMPANRLVKREDELVSMEIFKEFKKALKGSMFRTFSPSCEYMPDKSAMIISYWKPII